jgi:hypothetical protein
VSFISPIGMEQSKASLICMDLSNMAQFSSIFKKYLKKLFVQLTLPCWPLNLEIHISFVLKISFVKKVPCLQKITKFLDSSIHITKMPTNLFGKGRALGIKHCQQLYQKQGCIQFQMVIEVVT